MYESQVAAEAAKWVIVIAATFKVPPEYVVIAAVGVPSVTVCALH